MKKDKKWFKKMISYNDDKNDDKNDFKKNDKNDDKNDEEKCFFSLNNCGDLWIR